MSEDARPGDGSQRGLFRRIRRIHFAHCDPAGIVFFPRYFEMFNAQLEDWTAEALGAPFSRLHAERRIALPTVALETQFLKPSRLDDAPAFELRVIRLGRSSIGLEQICRDDRDIRVRLRQTIVATSLDALASVPLPEDLRAAIEAFGVAEPSALEARGDGP